jgi:hypothetical protein
LARILRLHTPVCSLLAVLDALLPAEATIAGSHRPPKRSELTPLLETIWTGIGFDQQSRSGLNREPRGSYPEATCLTRDKRRRTDLYLFGLALIDRGVSTPYELQKAAGLSQGATIRPAHTASLASPRTARLFISPGCASKNETWKGPLRIRLPFRKDSADCVNRLFSA